MHNNELAYRMTSQFVEKYNACIVCHVIDLTLDARIILKLGKMKKDE
jgi:hypothetical protein